jgi:hypothetical protein
MVREFCPHGKKSHCAERVALQNTLSTVGTNVTAYLIAIFLFFIAKLFGFLMSLLGEFIVSFSFLTSLLSKKLEGCFFIFPSPLIISLEPYGLFNLLKRFLVFLQAPQCSPLSFCPGSCKPELTSLASKVKPLTHLMRAVCEYIRPNTVRDRYTRKTGRKIWQKLVMPLRMSRFRHART